MFLELPGFLAPAELTHLTAFASTSVFVDGPGSHSPGTTKTGLQTEVVRLGHAKVGKIIMGAFTRSRAFQDFAMPRKISQPLISRYVPGMKFEPHADTAFISASLDANRMHFRSDISCTIFLNDPSSYQGGELVLHIGSRPVAVKGAPGEAFVYPSTLLQEVRPVASGQRLVAITFIESLIPDEQYRNILYELKEVQSREGLKMDWLSRVRMEVALHNLTRRWSRS